MGNRAVLQTCIAFFCGVMFGLYVYTYSTQGNLFHAYPVEPFTTLSPRTSEVPSHHDNLQRHYDNSPRRPANTRRRPLDNGSPSRPTFPPSEAVKPKTLASKTKVVTSLPQYVLILAYMRSGSTLTGDVIQQHRQTMYAFEPLYNIWQGKFSTFANGKKTVYTTMPEKTEESLRQLKAWFTCNILDVDLETLNYIFMDFGVKTRAVKTCLRKYNHFNETAKQICLSPMIKHCELSTTRVVKTIRLYAVDIEPLMKVLPTLKVIHLVRDPRGILVSRQRVDVKRTIGRPLGNTSGELCTRIIDDYNTVQKFKSTFPGRVMELRYEELATYPLETVKRIYKFIGLQITDRILNSVTVMTSSKKNIERAYNTARKDSVYTANAWRLKVPMNVTHIIDSACSSVYEKYGYKKVTSSLQLKNIKVGRLWIEKVKT